MPAVIPVRFKYNSRSYWYTYTDCEPKAGDYVVVARDGGLAFGWVADDPFELTDEDALKAKAPLKPIERLATDDDLEKMAELDEKGLEAKEVFRELAKKHNLDIKPIDVEYYLGSDKATFHFSSEERVDFRELVRDLASRLRVHVDMKQIGVRDEARLLGGLGHCGEMLCCVRLSGAFQPVSIKMAKEQDLPLNPSKVSGACGRLMCCLRYEFEAYKDFKSRAPKVGAIIETPAGDAKVTELNTLREQVKLKMLESDEPFVVPLCGMEADPDAESPRPCRVCAETFETHCPSSMLKEKTSFEVPEEELLKSDAEKPARKRRKKSGKKPAEGQSEQGGQENPAKEGQAATEDAAKPKSRRRRSHAKKGGSQQGQAQGAQGARAGEGQKPKQRPGQNSSNIRNPQGQDGEGSQKPKSGSGGRRRRGGGQGQKQGSQQAQGQGGQHKAEGGQQGAPRKRRPRRTSGGGQHKAEGNGEA